MKRLGWILALATGCAPAAVVEEHVPAALLRSEPVAVLHPGGYFFALDADVFQRHVAEGLRGAGFSRVSVLPFGRSATEDVRLLVTVRSELMARPLESDGDFATPGLLGMGAPRSSLVGERVRALLEIKDRSGACLYRAVVVEALSSALTEARVAKALLRPLEL